MTDQPQGATDPADSHAATTAAPSTAVSTTTASTTTADGGYAERLTVPLWWWPIAAAVTGLLAAEIHMGAPGIRAWLPYVVLLPLPIWALLWLGRMPVQVVRSAETELVVGRAHLPTSYISKVAAVPAGAKSAALGRQLDPAAFVQHRPWIGPMVLIVLEDPADPTPYWLVSTRKPERLIAALGLSSS